MKLRSVPVVLGLAFVTTTQAANAQAPTLTPTPRSCAVVPPCRPTPSSCIPISCDALDDDNAFQANTAYCVSGDCNVGAININRPGVYLRGMVTIRPKGPDASADGITITSQADGVTLDNIHLRRHPNGNRFNEGARRLHRPAG